MNTLFQKTLPTTQLLIFLVVAVILMGLVYEVAKPIIDEQQHLKQQQLINSSFPLNQQQWLSKVRWTSDDLGSFGQLMPIYQNSNDDHSEQTKSYEFWLVCETVQSTDTTVPVADSTDPIKNTGFSMIGIILPLRTVHGYAGEIDLLIGYTREQVVNVNVLRHSETPGLGDQIDPKKSAWLEQFQNIRWQGVQLHGAETSAEKISSQMWQLRQPTQPGFDSITAATITSKAVVDLIGQGASYAQKLLSILPTRQCVV